jgi:hypothetical protein
MWRNIRVTVLLVVLALVAAGAWLDRHRTTSWQRTVWVGAFALNADGSAASAAALQRSSSIDLAAVTAFINAEAHRYGVVVTEPVSLRLYPAPAAPPPPLTASSGLMSRAWWSLRMRWYRWRAVQAVPRAAPQIALFLLFHDPVLSPALPHSVGLQRGLTGVVHLFADPEYRGENDIVIAHELLHTFGATDKYDLARGTPRFPDGFADPEQQPRFPQRRAEIMAGRIPLGENDQVMAADFAETVVGPLTAREIGWPVR